MAQQTKRQQPNKYYRSIQYRSASLDIKPHKLNINTDKLPIFLIKKSITSKNHLRQSKRNLFRSQQNLTHFTKSLSQSLSKIHQSDPNKKNISQANPEDQKIHNFSTCSYIESFEELMESQQKHAYKRKKLGALSIKLDSLKAASKVDRIGLPNIIEYENSQFTALDPIRLPINSITEDIQKTRKSMDECPNQLKSIKFDLKESHERQVKTLQQFEIEFKQEMKKIWAKLRENSVYHQGFIMRMRREINGLESFIPEFKKELQATKNDQLQIQKILFETQPFQLKINRLQNNLPQQKYSFEESALQQGYF